ncbi:MAG TPA: GH92 family glycosyl hydrolase [Verrucomicrobiae bacterium]|jgi:predicted alpha-1,2-mannosidase
MKMKLVKQAAFRATVSGLLAFFGAGPAPVFGDTPGNLVNQVNAFMGANGSGHVVVGPQLPWGSVNPSPDTADANSSGYNSERKIRGFSQLHVTGTGSFGKYGQFLISPQVGLNVKEDGHDSDKTEEKAAPYGYQVRLKDYNILCELTPTAHAAIYRFTFPQTDQASIVLDLAHSIPGNVFHAGYLDEGEISVDPQTQTIKGWGNYWGGWSAEPVKLYFAARYHTPASAFGTWKNEVVARSVASQKVEHSGDRAGAFVQFHTAANQAVLLKIAVSFSSVDKAMTFLNGEIPGWDFSRVQAAAASAWDQKLGQIEIDGASPSQKSIFYTAFYDSMRMPKNRTGDNPAWRSEAPYWDDYYCVWDNWRTSFPLHVLLHESMVRDNIQAMIDRFQHNGEVQDAFIGGNDRYYRWTADNRLDWLGNQGGDDIDNLVADAFVKGVPGVDWPAAYQMVKSQADQNRAPAYRAQDRGWIPYRKYAFGIYCSRSLEFAYNDYCVAEIAAGLGQTNDFKKYVQRSHGWENLWNPAAQSDGYRGFIAPRRMNGDWVEFNPKGETAPPSPGGVDRSFYEGSSWIYSYFMPHDFARLIELSGGKAAYCERLEHALKKNLIDFGNEPSFLTLYSFIYAGRPDLCAEWVRKNEDGYTQNGFPGDEDGGAMGSWYVFAALGLMPNAGQDIYLLSGPMFPKATLTMENGRQVIIEAANASPQNIYVQSLKVNGVAVSRAWIRHAEIKDGATLQFVMGPQPSNWGKYLPPPANDH